MYFIRIVSLYQFAHDDKFISDSHDTYFVVVSPPIVTGVLLPQKPLEKICLISKML